MADDNLRQDMVDQVRAEQQQKPRSTRVHRAPRPANDANTPSLGSPVGSSMEGAAPMPRADDDGTAAPRKRRRRRRTGGNDAGGSAQEGGGSLE